MFLWSRCYGYWLQKLSKAWQSTGKSSAFYVQDGLFSAEYWYHFQEISSQNGGNMLLLGAWLKWRVTSVNLGRVRKRKWIEHSMLVWETFRDERCRGWGYDFKGRRGHVLILMNSFCVMLCINLYHLFRALVFLHTFSQTAEAGPSSLSVFCGLHIACTRMEYFTTIQLIV